MRSSGHRPLVLDRRAHLFDLRSSGQTLLLDLRARPSVQRSADHTTFRGQRAYPRICDPRIFLRFPARGHPKFRGLEANACFPISRHNPRFAILGSPYGSWVSDCSPVCRSDACSSFPGSAGMAPVFGSDGRFWFIGLPASPQVCEPARCRWFPGMNAASGSPAFGCHPDQSR